MVNVREVLTDSYCAQIRRLFENILETGAGKSSVEKREIELYSQLEQYQNEKRKVMKEWADTPIQELDGRTPSGLIKDMNEFQDIFELFLYMVENADDDVPYIIIEKLGTFGDKAVSALTGLADSCLNDQNTITVFIQAVLALGELKLTDAVQALIGLAYRANGSETFLDHIEEALKNAGSCAVEPLLEVLEGKDIGKTEEMLLYALACTGAKHKDDRIYKILRQAFRTMENKMPAVLCLNVYGDGRAIPMLKGYLERNRKIEKNLFFEIIGTIRNLGGITEEFVGF